MSPIQCPWHRAPTRRLKAAFDSIYETDELQLRLGTDEWKRLYRGRAAVEREFGRLKNEYGLTQLRTRGIDRVRLHADLTMLARLSQALARARAVPLAA